MKLQDLEPEVTRTWEERVKETFNIMSLSWVVVGMLMSSISFYMDETTMGVVLIFLSISAIPFARKV